MKLEDLRPGVGVTGLTAGVAGVVSVEWHGSDALTLVFRDEDGRLDERVLYRDEEPSLRAVETERMFPFDADGADFRLAAEAERIRLAHLYDPLLAIQTSEVEPLPHQITAVYEDMLPRQPLRFLLADDPGAGKTIMAGLLIRELIARKDVERCLVVCPGALVEQWQDELDRKFRLPFDILTRDKAQTAISGNWFLDTPLGIARLDMLARNEELKAQIEVADCRYDLVICDEAHKMSAQYFGQEAKKTKRYKLGEILSRISRHFLLMTATPHSGIEENFQLFLRLLDENRFYGKPGRHSGPVEATDLMRRMVKEKLLRFDGRPLFPERIAHTVSYTMSGAERELYEAVTLYVREEFARAEQVANPGRRRTVGFALTVLQRRLASSPEAIHSSLKRRRERLDEQRREIQTPGGQRAVLRADRIRDIAEDFLENSDEMPEMEIEAEEDRVLDQATAAKTVKELESEIATLRRLEGQAKALVDSGRDTKWAELRNLLDELFTPGAFDKAGEERVPYGAREIPPPQASPKQKLVLFTEHRATLDALRNRIRNRFGRPRAVEQIHGGMSRDARRVAQERFLNDPDVRVLLATDAAGEGINLQRAHLMVNYDLPWNPNRLEQRFGRIHRIGQSEVCHQWNLVARDTREGAVYKRLLEKLEQARKALGGQVFDVLGELEFDGKPLRDLLMKAVRYGFSAEAREHQVRVVEGAVDVNRIRELLETAGLASETMDTTRIEALRADMERAEARKLQPHHIGSFFRAAFVRAKGKLRPREAGRWETRHVPVEIREIGQRLASGRRKPVVRRYERVAFDKRRLTVSRGPRAEFLAPGHPLLDAVVEWTGRQYGHLLRRGGVLVDETDEGVEPRVVLTLSHEVRAGRVGGREPRVLSERMLSVELTRKETRKTGPAPHLDFRPLGPDEPSTKALLSRPEFGWIRGGLRARARNYAIAEGVPQHLNEVVATSVARIRKTADKVRERLTREIAHWDRRAVELRDEERAGKRVARLHWAQAERTASELQRRMDARIRELEAEQRIAPGSPVVTGGFVVAPVGLLRKLAGGPPPPQRIVDTQASAERARQAVMAVERDLGFRPVDRETEKLGYDVESMDPETGRLRFIEVKGRVAGADTVTVTRNEVLTALNKPESFILALVVFDEGGRETVRYLRRPFDREPDFGATSVNYALKDLLARAAEPS